MQTTDLRDRDDGPFSRVDHWARHRRVFGQGEMRSGAQIVCGVGLQGAAQALSSNTR